MATVADTLARTLREFDIDIVFGLPGGASLPLLAALRRHGIRFILVRNESSAVYMAAATARLTGRPGVALTTLGPGAANALAGVSHAYLDRAPVLIITADFPESFAGRHTHQVLDLQAIFKPMTKLSARLRPAGAARQIRAALQWTQAGRPGPVHLSLTGTEAEAEVTREMPGPAATPAQASPVTAPAADLARARALLAESRRPLIVTGLGLEPERPYQALFQLAEALTAPVIDTPKSKGAFPAGHSLYAGTIGLMQTDPAYELLYEADCILALGFDVVELVRPWDISSPLIWVANWDNEDPVIPAAVTFVGEIGPVLAELGPVASVLDPHWGARRVRQYRKNLAMRALPAPAPGRILPQQLLVGLHQAAPPDTLITTDVGSHKILAALEWPSEVPNRYLVSNGLSVMGFGVPAAIAAALQHQQPVVALTGDAGLGMVWGECSLLTEYDLPVIIVVMHDAALDSIRAKQLRRAEPAFGTEFTNPDFSAVAHGFGLDYTRIDGAAGAQTGLEAAFARARPALIEVLIDPISYPTSPGQAGRP